MNQAFDFDLSKWAAEDLAEAAQECGVEWATQELLDRHQDWMAREIARWARHRHLQPADAADAVQNGYLAFLEAIRSFKHPAFSGNQGHDFAQFLDLVEKKRGLDFLKALWRWDRHYDRSLTPEEALASGTGHLPAEAYQARDAVDPATLAEEHESQARVDAVVQALPEDQRQLWDWWAAGYTRAHIAERLGISPDQAKRRIHKMLERVKKELTRETK